MSTGVEGDVHNRFSGGDTALTGFGFTHPGAQAFAMTALLAGPSYEYAQTTDIGSPAAAGDMQRGGHAIG